MAGARCIDLVDQAFARHIAAARNATVIERHRDRRIVEIQLGNFADDSDEPGRRGNPLKYSYKGESEDNPQNVWTLKHLPDNTRAIFRAVVEECAA